MIVRLSQFKVDEVDKVVGMMKKFEFEMRNTYEIVNQLIMWMNRIWNNMSYDS